MPAARRWIAAALVGALVALVSESLVHDARSQTADRGRRPPTIESVYPGDLPEGAGREIGARACLMCHSASMITQQHKDSTAWGKTLNQMILWGAPVEGLERDTLRDYLTARFGPRK